MPIDDRTTNRSYQLPNAGNLLVEDVARLRAALTSIDADVFARYTKTEVDTLINDLIQGAPGALDTLNELAAAMGDDPNFAATVTNALALKANIADVYSKAESDARYVQGSTQAEMVFIATANQSVFTLTTAVINKPSALVTVDGVVQPTSEYSLNMTGTQLTLSEGVPVGTIVRVLALGVASQGAPADDTVTTPKLRDGAVTTQKLANSSVISEKIADGAITSEKILNGTVAPADLSTGRPSWDASGNLTAGGIITAGNYIISNNAAAASHCFMSGSVVGVQSSGNRHLYFYNGSGGTEGIVVSEASTGNVIIRSETGTDLVVYRDANLGAGAPYWRTTNTGGRIRMTTGNLVNFHWNGGFYYNIDNNNYVLINSSPSDANLKPIEGQGVPAALDMVMALKPVRFSYKEDCPVFVSTEPRYGFIAQDLQALLPELVQETGLPKRVPESPDEEIEDPGTYLRYANDASQQLIAVLTAGLQEAVGRIEALENRLSDLNNS